MRTRLLPVAVLLVLAAARPVHADSKADAKPAKPTIVMRLASLDSLFADARYLADLVGKGNEAEQGEKFIKTMAGKDMAGLDTTKPMGIYAFVGANGIDSEAVILVPVTDEKVIREKLEMFGMKPEKAEGDVWKLDVGQIPFPIFFKFVNGYVYVTMRDVEVLGKDRLIEPAKVLTGTGAFSAEVNLDQIPKELKEIGLSWFESQLAIAKDKDQPGESDTQKKLRIAFLDEGWATVKELAADGGKVTLQVNLDRKANNLSLVATMAGKSGSKLTKDIADLKEIKSLAAGIIGKSDAMSAQVYIALPEKLRNMIAPAVESELHKALEKDKDENKQKILEPLIKAIVPTLRMGELDIGFGVTQNKGSDELYTLVLAGKIKDGKGLEQALKEALKQAPGDVQGAITADVEKVGEVNIHKVMPDNVDENTRRMFGNNPYYLAIRDDALIVAGGPKALEAIKAAVTATPAAGKLFDFNMSVAKWAPVIARDNKDKAERIKSAFKSGEDTIHVTLEGGETLKLSIDMKTLLIKSFMAIDQEQKKAAKAE